MPYEGDMILEGRFGNSIRFGSTNNSQEISNPNAWSDSGNTGDPITIIRNGQSSNLDEKGWIPTTERINEDATSIYLTSNQRLQNFIQASPYMESWNAEYIEPQTIEQALLEPAPLSQLRVFAEYEICFGNSFCVNPNGHNIKTSGFNVTGIADTVYFSDTPNQDLKTGSIFLFKVDTDTDAVILLKNIGTVDYVKGEVLLAPIKIQSAVKSNAEGPIIEVSAKPSSNDVIGKKELYLQLDINNSTINMLADNIASGADISGSNFVKTASCGKTGSLIRN